MEILQHCELLCLILSCFKVFFFFWVMVSGMKHFIWSFIYYQNRYPTLLHKVYFAHMNQLLYLVFCIPHLFILSSVSSSCPIRSLMAKEGLKSIFPMEDVAVMGIWELLPHLNKFRVSSEQSSFI